MPGSPSTSASYHALARRVSYRTPRRARRRRARRPCPAGGGPIKPLATARAGRVREKRPQSIAARGERTNPSRQRREFFPERREFFPRGREVFLRRRQFFLRNC